MNFKKIIFCHNLAITREEYEEMAEEEGELEL